VLIHQTFSTQQKACQSKLVLNFLLVNTGLENMVGLVYPMQLDHKINENNIAKKKSKSSILKGISSVKKKSVKFEAD